jgi:hypothetical protein
MNNTLNKNNSNNNNNDDDDEQADESGGGRSLSTSLSLYSGADNNYQSDTDGKVLSGFTSLSSYLISILPCTI